jgi:DNA-binding transcriptional regulator YiaG
MAANGDIALGRREQRLRAGLSQQRLAELARCGMTTVRRWESDWRSSSGARSRAFADIERVIRRELRRREGVAA